MSSNHKLSDTSSLVLLYSQGEIHTSKNSKAYLKLLDMNPGKTLLSECNKIWPHYGEVIKNRKKCILDLALNEIKEKKISQVIIFGAGMDALSIELMSKVHNLVIYELDATNMSLKANLIKKSNSIFSNNIHCLKCDLRYPDKVLNSLKKQGWDSSVLSLLVFEGISYYLSKDNLFDLIGLFDIKNSQNIIILEYLLDSNSISKKRCTIPDGIFCIINKLCPSPITRYSENKIRQYFDDVNVDVLENYTLKDMEKNRRNDTLYFKTVNSGWINICLGLTGKIKVTDHT